MGSIQRGALIKKNDNGTLERVDGTGTYIGSATLPNGKVVTHTFRSSSRNNDEVEKRWLKWQGKQATEQMEEDMANTTTKNNVTAKPKAKCPFSGDECGALCPLFSPTNAVCSLMLGGIGLYNIASNLMKLKVDDELELIAMAIAEQKPSPTPEIKVATETEGVDLFLDGKKFLDFVNLSSKRVHSDYKKAVGGKEYPLMKESELMTEIVKRFPELKKKNVHGGSVLVAA